MGAPSVTPRRRRTLGRRRVLGPRRVRGRRRAIGLAVALVVASVAPLVAPGVAVAAPDIVAASPGPDAAPPTQRVLVSAEVASLLDAGATNGDDAPRPAVAAATERAARAAVASGASVVQRFDTFGVVAVDATPEAIEALRRRGDVASVTPERVLRPAGVNADQVGAPTAWGRGLTGAGQVVAVVDTGVQVSHPAFGGRVVGEACFTAVRGDGSGSCPNGATSQVGAGAAQPCATSDCGHGTHIAGIAIGGGAMGVAPGAGILAVQVFTSGASSATTSITQVLAALEWVLTQRSTHAVAAVNLSLSGPGSQSGPCPDLAVERAVAALADVGIAVVAASGNAGASNGIAYPACVPGIIAVGSVNGDDITSTFSNRSSLLDFFAPGEAVVSSVPGGGTAAISGTSEAAPHVSAAFAVLRQARPGAPLDEMVALLDRTADVVTERTTGRPAAAGAIRLDRALDPAYAAPITVGRDLPSVGAVDVARAVPTGIWVAGWFVDPGTVLPATVTVRVDGVAVATAATVGSRPDVAVSYPGYGDRLGWSVVLPRRGDGAERVVCAEARGARDAATTSLGCRTTREATGSPVGSLDTVDGAPGRITVAGWALDPDTGEPVTVHVYVDGAFAGATRTATPRADVGAFFAGWGDAHGYLVDVPADRGARTVCAYAIDVGVGDNALLGCRSATLPSGSPRGNLDVVTPVRSRPGGPLDAVQVAGWALDPDTVASIPVHVYVDGRFAVSLGATASRTDVAAALPGYGDARGFAAVVPISPGPHTVCVYGIDLSGDANALLGCRSVDVVSPPVRSAFDAVLADTATTRRVIGWAFETGTATTLDVHVYVDGAFAAAGRADASRSDVAAALGVGDRHGIDVVVPVTGDRSPRRVCVYVYRSPAGPNPLIGCRDSV
jgi:subtilisin family serine protease